ncbi:MAG: 16S rRNA processing protein RimM [Proteobacteria bacterium]|nr:16S rRNA processing protein RimM [Pseudomonadota bacterium]
MSKKILIAKVISAFGIKGEVKIVAYCQDILQIEKYPLFDAKGNLVKIKISNKNKTIVGKSGSNDPILIVKISGVEERNRAEEIRGAEFFVSRENFKETKKDEFYYVDLIGLKVINETKKEIGQVLNVQDFGAGGMLEIKFNKEFLKSKAGKDFTEIENLPFTGKIFPEVNLEEGFIRIDLPEVIKK